MRPLLVAIASAVLSWRGEPAAAQPSPGDEASEAPAAYGAVVQRAVEGVWRPADALRAAPRQGALGPWSVTVWISVAADGAVRDVGVATPSGLPAFDQEAVRAVRALQPFPAPPAERVDPAAAVFTFRLALVHPGWQPPRFTGDPLVRAPQTRSWEVGSSIDLERRSTALSGSASVPATASYDRTTLTLAAAHLVERVGLVELQVPIAAIRYRERATGRSRDVSGLGDVSLHLHRYRGSGRWSSGYFVGLRLPTGRAAEAPLIGDMLPAVVQLGSGTLDPEFGACMNLQLGAATALAACDHGVISLYSNSHDYRDSYEFHARLLLAAALFGGHAHAQAGVLYEHRSAAHWNGAELASTGHRELFAEASVWVLVVRGLSLRATLELPVFQSVNGMQLGDTVRALAGLSYDFDRL